MGVGREFDNRPLRFGVFELNPASGELRKHGFRIRGQDQPLKLLLCLLETPGELWSREDLIRRIWPEGTFVDYERGLNVAITRLRQALGDYADAPRYVETVGRKGYRFIAPIEPASGPEKDPAGQQETAAISVPEPAHAPRLSVAWRYGAMLMIGVAI